MNRSIKDIEHFDDTVNSLFKEAEKNRGGIFDLDSVGKRIGLDNYEIEALNYHLKRSDMIDKADGPLFRISKYGRMVLSGQITHGYVPI